MLGLFELSLKHEELVSKVLPQPPHVVPITHFNLGVNYLFSSIFVYYFATFCSKSFKVNVACFICRLLLVFAYAPLLYYVGAYIDGSIVLVVLVCRFWYLGYYALRFNSFNFVLLNSSTLAWVYGKCWYFALDYYVCLRGGDSYVKFGPHFIPFVSDKNLYIAVRGRCQKDICLVRRVELINGDFFYIFSAEPVVGITVINDNYKLREFTAVLNTDP
ncbi:ORF3 protein [Alphacoronavirus Bat-CoV/P.kuhlii/Italy/206645-41/2011]|nr:ORF3 protein [Alphacoronavirus Bat-CoV/P.kuhlii/Italy/206645-41/2011]